MKARIDAMSTSVDGTIRDAMQAIDRGALGMALLISPQAGRFEGLVTDGDIRRALLDGHGLRSKVAEVRRPPAKTARVGMPADQIAAMFTDPVRVVPMLDDDGCVGDLAIFDRRAHLPVAEPHLGEKELRYVSECVLTGWISSAGRFVGQFEEMFADFCGTQYAVSTSNGTTALHLSLVALGIGPGDEVIVPSLTFIATANAVRHAGATPVFVDSEATTWNLDPEQIEKAITSRTKAIIPVHLYGHPADMDPILEVASKHGLAVVEDAAEAHGARYKDRTVGSLGTLGVFSFYGNKIITTGEGGMIVCDDADLAERLRILRDHGMSPNRRYWHEVLGYNYRMTNLQAAVGVAQMEKVDAIIEAKRRIAGVYRSILSEVSGLASPPSAEWAESVFWLYSVVIDESEFGMDRDRVLHAMREKGVDCRPLFPPVHSQPIYNTGQHLPVAERLAEKGISLPSGVNMHMRDVRFAAEVLGGLCRKVPADQQLPA